MSILKVPLLAPIVQLLEKPFQSHLGGSMKKCPRSLYGDQWTRCKHFDGFIGNKVPMCYWFVMPVTDIMTNCCQIWQQYNLSVSLEDWSLNC